MERVGGEQVDETVPVVVRPTSGSGIVDVTHWWTGLRTCLGGEVPLAVVPKQTLDAEQVDNQEVFVAVVVVVSDRSYGCALLMSGDDIRYSS